MKEIFKAIKDVLLANWPALIGVALLAAILKIQFNFSFLLGVILLIVLYFVLGCLIEYIMQSYNYYKRTKSGKSAEQLKKEAEIRERRRVRGMEMLKDEQEKSYRDGNLDNLSERPVRRATRTSSVSSAPTDFEESRREIKPASISVERREKIRTDIKHKRTPFDIAPPAESIPVVAKNESETEDFPVEESVDNTFVDTDILDELYAESEHIDASEEVFSDEEIGVADDSYENADFTENTAVADDITEEIVTENVVETPMSIAEIQQTTADISKEIKERVTATRKRTHIIFDAYQTDSAESEGNDIFSEENVVEEDIDDFDKGSDDITIIEDEDDIPTTDEVNVNQDKLDELYEDSTEKNKNKTSFFSKALSGLKKKRNERKNRRNNKN